MKVDITHHVNAFGPTRVEKDSIEIAENKGKGSITTIQTMTAFEITMHINDHEQGEFVAKLEKIPHKKRTFSVISGCPEVAEGYFDVFENYFNDLIQLWKKNIQKIAPIIEGTTHSLPMEFPKKALSSKDFETTPLSKKILHSIEKLISKKLFQNLTANDYIEKFSKEELHQGLCYGQLSAIMLCNHNMKPGEEKAVVEKAKQIDSVAFQILNSLTTTLTVNRNLSKKIKDELKKRDYCTAKIEKIQAKSSAKKKEKKELKTLSHKKKKINSIIDKKIKKFVKEEKIETPPAGFVPRCYIDEKTKSKQEQKIDTLDHELLKEFGNLTFKKKLSFKIKEKEKLLSLFETYFKKPGEYQIRVALHEKEMLIGHGILVSLGNHASIYDQNIGLFTAKDFASFKDKYLKIFNSDDYDSCELEIFKRQM